MVLVAPLSDARHDELSVFFRGHAWELLDESHGRPKLLVTVIAPGRHAGHADPVFENPKQFRRRVESRDFRKIGRLGIKSARNIAFWNARGAVANRAMGCEMFRADDEFGWVVELRRRLDPGGVSLDRADTHRVKDPARHRPMRIARGNIEDARINEDQPANNDKSNRDGERNQKAAHARRPQNQMRTPKAKRKSPVRSPTRFA